MPPLDRLTVTFTLGARDLRHLRGVAERAAARASERPEQALAQAARARAAELRKFEPPAYVLERVGALEELIELLLDPDWRPPEQARARVRAALCYFTDPDDLIADSVPGLGFLDDAIVIELLARELRHERAAFRAFVRFRNSLQLGRSVRDPAFVGRRLAERRRALRARIDARERRQVVRVWRGR
ncbi:MAG TPA: YkvA family protein [Myxococcota bacterium]|nr:YkvA family protein [Myxococcota bacterium]